MDPLSPAQPPPKPPPSGDLLADALKERRRGLRSRPPGRSARLRRRRPDAPRRAPGIPLQLDLRLGRPVAGTVRHLQPHSGTHPPPNTLARLGEAIGVIRDLAEDREADLGGGHRVRIPWIENGWLPVWMAAYGPKALAVAGRLADGFILQLADPFLTEWMIKAVREAAADAGRDPSAVTICVAAPPMWATTATTPASSAAGSVAWSATTLPTWSPATANTPAWSRGADRLHQGPQGVRLLPPRPGGQPRHRLRPGHHRRPLLPARPGRRPARQAAAAQGAGRRPLPAATAPGAASMSVRSRTPAPAAGVARLCRCRGGRGRRGDRAGLPSAVVPAAARARAAATLNQRPQVIVHGSRPSAHIITNGRIARPVTPDQCAGGGSWLLPTRAADLPSCRRQGTVVVNGASRRLSSSGQAVRQFSPACGSHVQVTAGATHRTSARLPTWPRHWTPNDGIPGSRQRRDRRPGRPCHCCAKPPGSARCWR